MHPSWSILVSLLLIVLDCWTVKATTNSEDFAVLTSLKRKWKNTPPNWVKRDPCASEWVGISCSDSRVTSINLSGTNLTGMLPEEILSLTELQHLDLSNNKGLRGPLPLNIGSLKNLLTLALMGCNFSGPIPESIGSLRQLTHLFLNSNSFTGSIPHSIGNLEILIWLDLSNNLLNGTIPISNKTALGMDNLHKTKHFHLGHNNLSGEIPPDLFTSKMTLIHLILNHNKLKGSIPDTLGLVPTLQVIRLDRNKLSGSLPQNFSNLISIKELYLANNNLSGPLPNLTAMNSLTYIDLSNNSFNAPIDPRWFATFQNLTTLMMESTGLQGLLPMTLFNLPQLQTVILKNNKLNGSVDIGTSSSSNLQLIDLRNNLIDEFSSGEYNNDVLLYGNPFCMTPEATGKCKPSQVSNFSIFVPNLQCAPLSCFSDIILGPVCNRPYLGSLIFRSFNFSDLRNEIYYKFLMDSLKPLFNEHRVPVNKVCLVRSVIDTDGNLVLNIAIFPPDGVYFNRTGISTVGNFFNIHTFDTPYGPYYFADLTYNGFPDLRQSEGPRKNPGLVIGLTISVFMLLSLSIAAGVYAYHQHKKVKAIQLKDPFAYWDQGDAPQLNGIRWFSFEDIKIFTNNFSSGSEIGGGGYGKVYKGRLETGQLVAIKRAQGSVQGATEFKSEIELLSRVHHKNVVNLVGFCCDKGEQMLIYEYIPNDNLRTILSGKGGVHLNWTDRLRVALGAAKGVAYLHELADPPIIHRDIKSSNILLDDHFNAKVADFGLSKPLSTGRDYISTQVKGTMGYLDPEYCNTWQLTEKSDVYSFGVVMLELVTGRSPIGKTKYIVREVEESLRETGDIYSLIDPAIGSDHLIGLSEFVHLAMRCVTCPGTNRPMMGEVVKEIEDIIRKSNLIPITDPSNLYFMGRQKDNNRIQQQWLLHSHSKQQKQKTNG